ncbi:response regulator transcription factor [Deinococcus sonorensis]|uniref:Response regulator n=2 Tax=Deinococcus sonorensis TaxID=309891 RepID=A0AAU7U8U5_9DEIO
MVLPPPQPAPFSENGPERHVRRLLLVDDERQILELLDLSLSSHGFEVMTAQSGEAALALARAQRYDLIVLDVLMTPWDGFRTARELKRLSGCPPIVFLSGMSGLSYEEQGLSLGAAYLNKPFRPAQLIEMIWRVLDEES